MVRKRHTTVSVSPEYLAELTEIAAAEHRTKGAVLRLALTLYRQQAEAQAVNR